MDAHGLLIDKKAIKLVLFCMIWIGRDVDGIQCGVPKRNRTYVDAKTPGKSEGYRRYCQMLCMTCDQAASFLTPSTKGTPSMTSAIN